MSRIRFFNAKIAQFSVPGGPAVTGSELWTDGERISYIGPPRGDAIGQSFSREIDCRGNLLLPGFKNAHTHAAMVFLRSSADDLPLQTWLTEQVYPFEGQLTEEDIYPLVQLAIMEFVSSGMTAMFDMYFHLDAATQAAIDAGFRMALVGATNDHGGNAKRTEAEFKKYNALHPLISYRMGIHAEYTCSEPLLMEMLELNKQLRAPFCTHLCETAAEVQSCIDRFGLRTLPMLERRGAFDYGGTGFHLVHLDARDREILKDYGMYAVTCPASNMKLASGVAPVCELLEDGVPVAIGTDGAASNNCLDFFREMFLVTGLQKLRRGADACDALSVLRMACETGARALYLPDCDDLALGKQADLVMIDLHRPNMQPENNLLKNVVYAGSKENVALTMVAGKILYEHGTFFIGADPESVYEKANAIIGRMKNAL